MTTSTLLTQDVEVSVGEAVAVLVGGVALQHGGVRLAHVREHHALAVIVDGAAIVRDGVQWLLASQQHVTSHSVKPYIQLKPSLKAAYCIHV